MLSDQILADGGGGGTLERTPFEYDTPFQTLSPGQNAIMNAPQLTGQILDETSFLVSWTPVEGATNYNVRRDGGITPVGNRLSYPYGSLPAGATFRVDVQATGNGLESAFSNQLLITPAQMRVDGAAARTQAKTSGQKIIFRPATPQTGNGLPRAGASGAAAQTPVVSTAAPATEDLLFGFDRTTVLIVGGVGAGGLLLYMLSGKK
jgi:hypothetical protein